MTEGAAATQEVPLLHDCPMETLSVWRLGWMCMCIYSILYTYVITPYATVT